MRSLKTLSQKSFLMAALIASSPAFAGGGGSAPFFHLLKCGPVQVEGSSSVYIGLSSKSGHLTSGTLTGVQIISDVGKAKFFGTAIAQQSSSGGLLVEHNAQGLEVVLDVPELHPGGGSEVIMNLSHYRFGEFSAEPQSLDCVVLR